MQEYCKHAIGKYIPNIICLKNILALKIVLLIKYLYCLTVKRSRHNRITINWEVTK